MPPPSDTSIAALDCARKRRFEVVFADGLATGDSAATAAVLAGRRLIVVTTSTVDALYRPALMRLLGGLSSEHRYVVMRVDERRKQMPAVQKLCRIAAEFKLDRHGAFVAIGGGVCSDIVTLAASMVRRGVDHVRMPTTLIGQIDAGIGIKGAVNLEGLKSFVGTFHPPAAVLVDPEFLRTLPAARLRQGLSEIIKMALVRDAELFARLEAQGEALLHERFQAPIGAREVIARSIQLMLEELQNNPFEDQGFERLVDFGHTFSPTLEARSRFSISHGEAVAIDMALSAAIGVELGLCPAPAARRIVTLLARLGLPVSSPLMDLALCREAILSTSAHRGGRLNLVVPTRIGAAAFVGADALGDAVLARAFTRLAWLSPVLALDNGPDPIRAAAHRFDAEHASPAV